MSAKGAGGSASASTASSLRTAFSLDEEGVAMKRLVWILLLAHFLLAGCTTTASPGLEQIETIVVIYAENRSFDHLYGLCPGASGLAQANDEQKTQLDHDGRPLA